MVNILYKKIIVFAVVVVFLGLTTAPTINARITKNNVENLIENIHIQTNYNEGISTYDLLIISPEKFSTILQPLVDHKESIGISTKLVTLDEVYENMFWHGRDKQEKIKYFIKNAVEEWGTKYVLLVGDFRQMPIRYCHNADVGSGFDEPYFISELYYADIYDKNGNFSSWDANNNGIYGEWLGNSAEDSNIDLHPDVYVGRLACINSFEVQIMVNKIIEYETKTFGQDWFNKFVVVAGDTYPEGQYPFDTSGYEGEENTLKAIENMTGFNIEKLWISDGSLTGPRDVIRTISKGCGLMLFDGHASPLAWGTHPHNSEEFIYGLKLQHMWRLSNGYKMPVVVAGACHNAQFDVTPLNLLNDFKLSLSHGTYPVECWAWKLTSKPFGGSIATISNTGLGMSKEDKDSMEGAGDFMDLQFFYAYGHNYSNILGEIWGAAIDRYLDHFPINWSTPAAGDYAIDAKTVQEWVLLGDPSLKIGGYP